MRDSAKERLRRAAGECGFELAGVARTGRVADYVLYEQWVAEGMAGGMGYLADRRAGLREDPQRVFAAARSVICVGKLYKTKEIEWTREAPRISNYAWGPRDYHEVLREGLERLAERLKREWGAFEHRTCVDTAPLLERSLAREAGLGWIGRNTCLIHEESGSWYFLGELLVSLDLEPDAPPPDRCGTCMRCIQACPTQALVPAPGEDGRYQLDARRCISYLTIELKGEMPEEQREDVGTHVFGCDICQEVCPWNGKAPATKEAGFQPAHAGLHWEEWAAMNEDQFRRRFRATPLWRVRQRGLLRNVAVALGNTGEARYRELLEGLAGHEDEQVAAHARWGLSRLSAR